MIKFKGIKKAMGVYNWAKKEGFSTIFYMDTRTNEVWCNYYTNQNSWSKYDDVEIIAVNVKEYLNQEENIKLTMELLNKICNYTSK